MNKTFTIINLLLLTVLSYFGVQAFYASTDDWFRIDPKPALKAARAPSTVTEGKKSIDDYRVIENRNLFKLAKKTAPPPPPPPPPAPEVEELQLTNLNLKLWGTIIGSDGSSYAIIEDPKTREQSLYRSGDSIQTASLKTIFREKVVLTVGNKDEILKMEDLAGSSRKRGLQKPARPAQRQTPVPPADGENIAVERSKIEQATKNLNQLMRQARIRPHFTNGKPDGIRLSGIRPGSIFEDIGFKSGDIITSVNGESIESVDDALKFYSSLKSAQDVSLQIRRNGLDQNINYTVE
jgi:general secretion pathway protein C